MIFDPVVSLKRFTYTNDPVNPRLLFIFYSDCNFIFLVGGLCNQIELCTALRYMSLWVSPRQGYREYLIKMA